MTSGSTSSLQGCSSAGFYAMFGPVCPLTRRECGSSIIGHGDFIVPPPIWRLVSAAGALGLNPIAADGDCGAAMAAAWLRPPASPAQPHASANDLLPRCFVNFGLSVIIQNGLLNFFTADSRRLQAGAIEVRVIPVVAGISIGVLPLLQFAIAVAVIGGMQFVF